MTASEELFRRARQVIPGGVNSPVRAFGAVGGMPRFVARGEGAYLVDADGRRYVDLVQSWGALLFGHARSEIVEAAVRAAEQDLAAVGHVNQVADRTLVDGFVNLFAAWTYSLGVSLHAIQTGRIRQYVMFIVIGAVAIFVLISFFWSPTLAR